MPSARHSSMSSTSPPSARTTNGMASRDGSPRSAAHTALPEMPRGWALHIIRSGWAWLARSSAASPLDTHWTKCPRPATASASVRSGDSAASGGHPGVPRNEAIAVHCAHAVGPLGAHPASGADESCRHTISLAAGSTEHPAPRGAAQHGAWRSSRRRARTRARWGDAAARQRPAAPWSGAPPSPASWAATRRATRTRSCSPSWSVRATGGRTSTHGLLFDADVWQGVRSDWGDVAFPTLRAVGVRTASDLTGRCVAARTGGRDTVLARGASGGGTSLPDARLGCIRSLVAVTASWQRQKEDHGH